MTSHQRRYDLDWLRILAFGLLIFYHIGMVYVPWGFHVNAVPAVDWLVGPMRLSNLMRLCLLFIISGIAVRYMVDKMTLAAFHRNRWLRLFLPLIFAVCVILPPQAYVEAVSKGIYSGDYFTFWASTYFSATWPEGMMAPFPTYNHMWYVAYLFIYSLVLIGGLMGFRRLPRPLQQTASRSLDWLLSGWRLALLPLVYLVVVVAPLEHHFGESHAFVGDWAAHVKYGFMMLLGFWIARREASWQTIWALLPYSALVALLAAFALLYDDQIRPFAGPFWRWSILLTVFGLALKGLNHPSRALAYLTPAVYPFYILHQSLIVVGFYLLTDWHIPQALEAGLLVLFTFGGCFLLYEGIRRVAALRPLFGLKRLN